MSPGQFDVLMRAAEAGHFRSECARWWNAALASVDEDQAEEDFSKKAAALVDDPSVLDAFAFSQKIPEDLSREQREMAKLANRVWGAAREEMLNR